MPFCNIHVNLNMYVSYMSCAGSFAAMPGGPPSAAARVTAVWIWPRAAIVAIPVAVVAVGSVAVVTVSYSVIYQGAILVLTELTDQLGFQS